MTLPKQSPLPVVRQTANCIEFWRMLPTAKLKAWQESDSHLSMGLELVKAKYNTDTKTRTGHPQGPWAKCSIWMHLNAFDTWIETASSQTIGSPVLTATIKMNITTDTTLPNFSSYLSPWHLCPLLCAASHGYHGWMSQLDIRSRARLLQLHAAFDHEPCVLVYWNRGNPTRPGKPTSFTWLSAWLSAFWSRISLQRILMGSRAALSFVAWKASVPKSFEDGKTCLEQHAVGQW